MILSIIVPLYNKEKEISRCLHSMKSQSFSDWECIIVDDGSKDNSAAKVKEFSGVDSRFIYFYQENQGVSAARNNGVLKARGNYIIYMDADDYFLPDVFEKCIKIVMGNASINCFCFNFIYHGHLYCRKTKEAVIVNNFYSFLLQDIYPRPGACIISRGLAMQYPFDQSLRRYEDTEYILNLLRSNKILYSPIPIMEYVEETTVGGHIKNKTIDGDFLGQLNPKGKCFLERVALYRLSKIAYSDFPLEAKNLYPKSTFNICVRFVNKIFRLISLIK